jgi:hypothetical protein
MASRAQRELESVEESLRQLRHRLRRAKVSVKHAYEHLGEHGRLRPRKPEGYAGTAGRRPVGNTSPHPHRHHVSRLSEKRDTLWAIVLTLRADIKEQRRVLKGLGPRVQRHDPTHTHTQTTGYQVPRDRFLRALNSCEECAEKTRRLRRHVMRLFDPESAHDRVVSRSSKGDKSSHGIHLPDRQLIPFPQVLTRTERLAQKARRRAAKKELNRPKKNDQAGSPTRSKKPRTQEQAHRDTLATAAAVNGRIDALHDEFVKEWEEELQWNVECGVLPPSRPVLPGAIDGSRSVFHHVGVLRVQVVELCGLADVQNVGRLQPYAKATLLPWGDCYRTKHVAVSHPQTLLHPAEHGSILDFPYRGRPPGNVTPSLKIEVLDVGVFKVCRTTLCYFRCLSCHYCARLISVRIL